MSEISTSKPITAYDRLGGKPVVRSFVDRFYDLMDSDPAYRQLRSLHAPDLAPMRDSLTGFLVAWLGGPRDWFDEHPEKCMMSAHRGVGVTEETARQWAEAMDRAIDDSVADRDLAAKMAQALAGMATAMAAI